MFIKPTNRGGGVGIDANSVVSNFEELKTKVVSVSNQLDTDSLVENYLSGREFSVAILRNDNSDTYSVMPIELIAGPDEKGARILSSKVKASKYRSS